VELYKETYKPLLMDVITVPSPDCFTRETGESWESHTRKMFAHMEQALEKHGAETAAVILEPLVQCAGNMRMYHPIYLKLLREACDRHGVLLIADEIAVGFGRTGTLFACEQEGVSPDFLCLAKGLTGGYLPMAATLTTEEIHAAFNATAAEGKTFYHGHTYGGNPLGAAVALANLRVFDDEATLDRLGPTIARLAERLAAFATLPHVGDVRQCGLIAGVELVADRATKAPYPWPDQVGARVCARARDLGLLIRPLGDVLVVMPPLAIRLEQLDEMLDVMIDCVREVTEG
jgi:adenosylmethionine-8-amino-7-oxononanoate aminotransferase